MLVSLELHKSILINLLFIKLKHVLKMSYYVNFQHDRIIAKVENQQYRTSSSTCSWIIILFSTNCTLSSLKMDATTCRFQKSD